MPRKSSRNFAAVTLLILATPFLLSAQNQPQTEAPASSFRLEQPQSGRGSSLYVTIGGKEKKIFDQAFQAWIINHGGEVVFSGRDGAGGFENEGQSLRIYNVRTGATQKILSEYVMVTALQAVKISSGATALLVKMEDGGLGGSYFAVVDPKRGQVFYRQWAEAGRISGDTVTLSFFREDDFDALLTERGGQADNPNQVIVPTKVRSYKQEKIDLKKVLRNRVIYNKPSYLDDVNDPAAKAREVKIYLWSANSTAADIVLLPVTRQVGGAAVLRLTMEMLFAGTNLDEEAKGLSSSTFGMTVEDVALRNGVALVKFSQPPNRTNYGSLGPMIFAEAIDKTARQFPTVKRVQVCAVGDTLIDSQLEKPFPKCSK